MKATTPSDDFLRGIWRENPVLIQMLGLCPALAVTNTVENSLAMGLATFFVLLFSSLFVSLLKRFIPHEVRISTDCRIAFGFPLSMLKMWTQVVPGRLLRPALAASTTNEPVRSTLPSK